MGYLLTFITEGNTVGNVVGRLGDVGRLVELGRAIRITQREVAKITLLSESAIAIPNSIGVLKPKGM